MAQQYWIKLTADGDEHGPYGAAEIRTFAKARQIEADTLVSFDRAAWHPARRFKGLFPDEEPTPVPPVPVKPSAPAEPMQTAAVNPINVPAPAAAGSARDPIVEREYRGIFLFLTLCGLIIGIVCLVTGGVGGYFLYFGMPVAIGSPELAGYRSFGPIYSPPPTASTEQTMIGTAVLLCLGLVFTLAFITRNAEFGKILLLLGACLLVLLGFGSYYQAVIGHAQPIGLVRPIANGKTVPIFEPLFWRALTSMPAFSYSLAFPVLSIVGVVSWFRYRRS